MGKSFFIVAALVLTLGCAKAQVDPVSSLNSVDFESITLEIGGKHMDSEGYDLMGILTGSEGLLGVVTKVTVRILRKPETARALLIGFPSSEDAGQCVAGAPGAFSRSSRDFAHPRPPGRRCSCLH